jgi:hypothetical protein
MTDYTRPTDLTLDQFLRIVDRRLLHHGYPISISDLPDQDFYAYYDQQQTRDEAIEAADELIAEMVAYGDLPDLGQWADEGGQ